MVGTFMSLKQTMSTVGGVLDKVENAAGGDIKIKNNEMALLTANGSIIRLLSTFVIEPTIVVSREMRNEDIVEKLIETNVDIFASFYVQAFTVLTNIYGHNSSVAFDILSSKGNMPKASNNNKKAFEELSLESMSILPIKDKTKNYLSLEQHRGKKPNGGKNSVDRKVGSIGKMAVVKDNGTIIPSVIQKNIDLTISINKVVTSTNKQGESKDIENGTREIVVPILIKANLIYSDFNNIEVMISTNDKDKHFGSRLDEYKAGLTSLQNLIFAGDLIKEYKKNKFKDKDSLIDYMENRSTAANKKLLSRGAIGFAKFYGVLIVTKRQMSMIENKLGGSIDKPKYKEMLMDQTKSLLVNSVDTDWERVSIYTKDLKGTSDVSYKVLSKRKGDKDTSELAEIFKALTANKPPVF